MHKINEAEITSSQIKDIFRKIESEEDKKGSNRSAIGKKVDQTIDFVKNIDESSDIEYIDHRLTKYHNVVNEARGFPVNSVQLTEAGIRDMLSRAGKWVKSKGRELSKKVSYESLIKAWQAADYPSDSVQIEKLLKNAGIDDNTVYEVFTSVGIPYSGYTSRAIGDISAHLSSRQSNINPDDSSPGAKAFSAMQSTLTPKPVSTNAPFASMVSDLTKNRTTPTSKSAPQSKMPPPNLDNMSPEMQQIRNKLKQASRPLSMTPDAIRKREARAKQKSKD